jgi:EF-hand domain pair/EF hand
LGILNRKEFGMKKFLMAGAAGIALLASGVAIAHNHGGHKGKMMDLDGNGEVTRVEAATAADTAFARMDANKDGVLNATDRAERKGDRFANMDTNKDGQLTKSELDAAHAARNGADWNGRAGNRMANMTEEQKAEWQAKRAERQANHFAMMDTDKNGALTETEFIAGHAAMKDGHGRRGKHKGQRGGMMMERADTNGDKAISKSEFTTAAMGRFDRMDADKNGVISATERQAMKGKRGAKRGMADMGSPAE